MNIYVVGVGGGMLSKLIVNVGNNIELSWLLDGGLIYFILDCLGLL